MGAYMSGRANLARRYDLVALGGGAGGLVGAAGGAYLGLRTAIVERDALGGDCLWTGCVPSKALVASARLARRMHRAAGLGLAPSVARHDFRAVMDRMRAARAKVARHDDPERFRRLGVEVHFGDARFLDPNTVEVKGVGTLRSRRFLVATGATPAIPPVPGLAEAPYRTHETVFDQNELPGSIAIVGGGPVGIEFAQVFARLGSRVTILEAAPLILTREDPEAAAFMRRLLEEEGIGIRTAAAVARVRTRRGGVVVETGEGGSVEADRLLVATGRRPCTEGLDPEAGGIRTVGGAIVVDRHLRTTSKSAWGVGDVTGAAQFTHVAEQMAKVALRNSILPARTRIRYDGVPRVTYTDPEVAHVGLSEAEAQAAGGTTYRYEMDDLDRAIVDDSAVGFVKISADRRGRVAGATIVARGAGELLMPLVLAKRHGLSLGKVADTVFPYPSMAEGVKCAAGEYMRSRLDTVAGRTLKRIVRWLK